MDDKSEELAACVNLGIAHYRLGNYKTAIHYYERALKIAKDLGDRSGEGKVYENLGIVHRNLGHYETAIHYNTRHLKIAEELNDKAGEGNAYGNLGNAYHCLGKNKTAKDYHERHLKIAEEQGDRLAESKARCNLGNTHLSLGHVKTAIANYESHLKIAKELDDRLGKGKAYGNLGHAYCIRGDFKTAVHYNSLHLNIAEDLGDKSGESAACGNLGNAHYNLGHVKTAIYYYERVLKIAKDLGDRSGEGKAYGNLGIVHRHLGDFETAIQYYERHLKIAEELRDKAGEGNAYGNLGSAYHHLGNIERAIYYHKRHLKIAKKLGDRLGQGKAYCNLGNTYHNLGRLEKAFDYHKRYLKIAEELGDKSSEGRAYGSLGNVHHSLGDYKQAIECHSRHLEIAKKLGDRSGEGGAYGNLGNVHQSLGDFETSKYYHECHLKIAKELEDTLGEGIACSNLGKSFELLGQSSVAIEYYQKGISFLNNIRDRLQLNDERKIGLRDRYQRTYTALWRLRLTEGNVTEALFSAEQGRAQGLKDLMKLNYSFKRKDACGGSGTGVKTVNELLSYLPPNTIFMAFGENELIFWVCQRGKEFELRKKQIHSEDEVENFLKDLLQAVKQEIGARDLVKCEDRSLEFPDSLALKSSSQHEKETQHLNLQKSALSTLYDAIIEPIQDLLLGTELMFVPEGPLCLAPFAVFKGPNSKYLCESFKIRVAPSLTSLKMIADCPGDYHHQSGALLVGDPLTELSPLLCAREEVEMIGRMLGITPVLGTQATKDEVLTQLGSVALVHIAAHGNMKTGEIALASTEDVKKDILTMRDVLGVQMRARLVVLSCCHSARGEIKAEGVVGIARAFLGAGARSVLVSLWAIDDKATLEFMKNFYQHLVKGISASESLNQTMNCMRESEEFNAVKYWAPFVLIGDDVTLEFAGNE